MKKGFHKTLSVLMACVVMFSTMSFTVDMHYCGDSLVDYSLFQKAKSCGMESAQATKDCEPVIGQEPCCSNQQIVKEANHDLKASFDNLSSEQQTLVAAFLCTHITISEVLDENTVHFRDYSPPVLIRDMQSLLGTYLT